MAKSLEEISDMLKTSFFYLTVFKYVCLTSSVINIYLSDVIKLFIHWHSQSIVSALELYIIIKYEQCDCHFYTWHYSIEKIISLFDPWNTHSSVLSGDATCVYSIQRHILKTSEAHSREDDDFTKRIRNENIYKAQNKDKRCILVQEQLITSVTASASSICKAETNNKKKNTEEEGWIWQTWRGQNKLVSYD